MENNFLKIRLLAHNSEFDNYTSEIIELLSTNNFQLVEKSKVYSNRSTSQPESRIYLSFIKKKTNGKT